MPRAINKIRAEGTAWKIIQEYCLDQPDPVPVKDIAMDRGVLCLESVLTGCLGRLIRKGSRGIIRTDIRIREEGRKRFAVAHELGHWFLHEHESQYFVCTGEQMRDYKGSPVEVEANLFASELLMPTFVFRGLAESAEPRLSNIKNLACTFNTSLTASAMKFIDTNRNECALVWSTGGVIKWSKQQDRRSGLRIAKGARLHSNSLAIHVCGNDVDLEPELVPPEAWFCDNFHEREIEVSEESWAIGEYDSVLTLLVITDGGSS